MNCAVAGSRVDFEGNPAVVVSQIQMSKDIINLSTILVSFDKPAPCMKKIDALYRKVRIRLKRLGARIREEFLSHGARWSRMPRFSGRTPSTPLIASLTSFGKRLDLAHVAIEGLMRQSLQPQCLILWIPENVKVADLSSALRNQMKRGLEIRGSGHRTIHQDYSEFGGLSRSSGRDG